MSFRSLIIAVAFVACFMTVPASAQSRISVGVMTINSVEGDDATTDYLSARIRQIAENIDGWSVRSDVAPSVLQMELALSCETTEISCLHSIATTLRVGALIFGEIRRVMTADGPDFVLDMAFYDALEMRVVRSTTMSVPLHSSVETLHSLALRVVEALSGSSPSTAGAIAAVEDDRAERSASSSSTPTPASGASISIPGVTLLSLAAATFGAAIYSWVRLADLDNDPLFYQYRASFPAGSNACTFAAEERGDLALAAHARDVCGEGNVLEVLQHVFWVSALALAGVGTTLVILDATASPAGTVEVLPSVTPESASLSVLLRL
jgi:hypothetical protein